MCDERERLIGYVYDEVDTRERAAVDAHLSDCHVCRAEVAGLRSVREDLLAWDVPQTEPVWRPLAPVALVPVWRQVPAWAMAAAASLVFAAGAAGGATTRLMWPIPAQILASTPAPAAAIAAVPIRPAAPAVTSEDLAALEAKVVARVRAEMAQPVQSASPRPAAAPAAVPAVDTLVRQVKALEAWQYDQVALNEQFDRKLRRLGSVTSTLDARMATDADMRMVIPVSFGGGR